MSELLKNDSSYYEIPELWGRENIELSQAHVLKTICNLSASLSKKELILDAGCGDGLISGALKKIRPELNIVGIDRSYNAISHLPQKGLAAVCSDICSLPFPDDFFSITWCMDVFEHLPPKVLKNAFSELKRVTRKYLLIVTPAAESDSIVVHCPNCVTIFNPYHHVNYFTVEQWLLLQEEKIDLSFIPLGNLKSNLPIRGLRKYTVADELYAPVEHTQCPLCQEIFSVQAKNNMGLNGNLAAYCAENKNCFGNRFEELGILLDLSPGRSKGRAKNTDKAAESEVILQVSSVNHINFNDFSYSKTSLELFNQGGFYLLSEALNIVLKEKCYFIQQHGKENRAIIVLHPSNTENTMNLMLSFRDNFPGTLHFSVFNRTTNCYEKFQEVPCPGNRRKKSKKITFEVSTNHITPYGILLEISCTPAEDKFELELLQLTDNEFPQQSYPLSMENAVVTIDELANLDNKQLSLQFPKQRPEKLQLLYKNIKYDLSHLLTGSGMGNFLKIPRTLLTDINEL